ncbi:hypothetical protein [Chromobacterium violaceum]|uniref:hypothetical protein n=1 Tax=Chromobacterium violaceum TaxID=536 RepID=UPI001952434E|nr:hypothetical protein [Chromobacterium violaceum]QRO34014.1 hypothetical protein I6K04_04520 [Chromobacterium violaceum]QRQ16183.1 hypothetical protein I6K03_18210 [Chromobacterium violaceum]
MDEIVIAKQIRKTPLSAEDAIYEQLSADNHLLRHRCQELEKSMDERNAALMLANQYRHGLELDNRRLLKQLEEQGYVITALRAAAAAATPGPHHIYTHMRDDNNWKANEEWHQAAAPDVFLSLLADLEAMAQELLAYRADSSLDTAGATIRAQAARIAELERDAATRDAEIASALPGTYYMDPPDGGDVPLLEQLRRTALDAARYRAFRAELLSADERNEIEDSMRLMVGRVRRLRGDDAYPTTEEFDSAIDAAMEQNQSPNCG